MKTIPPPCPEPETGPKYWRSLDQLADTPAFQEWVEREFPAGASELTDPVSRRHFVKIMSASFLLAGFGLTGCRRPEEKILPFGNMPPGYVHGVAKHFATAMPTRSGAIPLVVKSHEGRPVKIEGNPQHPDSNGGTDVFAQASILNLYDPDRAQQFKRGGHVITRAEALDALAAMATQFRANQGKGLAFLAPRSTSPSRERLMRDIAAQMPNARWHRYEPVELARDEEAATVAFGKPVRPYYRFAQASVIVSLDNDFIGSEENAHLHIRGFAKGRRTAKPTDPMNRLYVVESLMTQTGANADHRLAVPPSAVAQAAGVLAEKLLGTPGGALIAAIKQAGPLGGPQAEWLAKCADDLLKPENKGKSLVLAGHRQPLAVHLVAQAINAALGNIGATVVYHDASDFKFGTLAELRTALDGGAVDTLVILGGNPVYDAPADFDWKTTQRKAKTVVRLGYYEDETSAGADLLLPQSHYLESWGDARTSDGTVVPVQPLIQPLFSTLCELEVLARIGGLQPSSPYEIARATFRALAGEANFEEAWKKFLHDGFLAGTAAKPAAVQFNFATAAARAAGVPQATAPTKDALEVVFHRDSKLDDGRYNNNGWLQELPDPITKMVWDNVVLMSQKTADELGVVVVDRNNLDLQVPLVEITLAGRKVTGPAWVQPGMADYVIGLALGYGREQTGRVGRGTGFNAYTVRTSAAPDLATKAAVQPTPKAYALACTQNHWTMEGRPIVREANLEQYRQQPNFARGMNMPEPPGPRDPEGRPLPLYPNPLDVPGPDGKSPRERANHAWGMSIDLSACVGCSACLVACQSENNIPIVGKDLISRGREMHWLRIDRYYAGPLEAPQVANQPMMCQHCEAAPCESVCPVNATVHDDEGLNVMAYNRCVGTRYCSNNCPYKVRRFNYLDYNKRPLDLLKGPVYTSPLVHSTDGEWDLKRWWNDPDTGLRPHQEWELLKLAKNPDVTVRMRGVMEKCTFCLQRIEQAKITQKVKAGASGDVEVPDGTIKTACEQACPAEAIVFGNLKDPNSRVSQLKKQERDYSVLEFLLTKPRATYLARVRNPNPAMPDYHQQPLTLAEWESKGNHLPGAEKKGGH
jgi:molybdopterin-containing oxidoreductase family iron-sulfur binding subunit